METILTQWSDFKLNKELFFQWYWINLLTTVNQSTLILDWYVVVDKIIWFEMATLKVLEKLWLESSIKLLDLVEIWNIQKEYSWFIQDIINCINTSNGIYEWEAYWLLSSSYEITDILRYFRDHIFVNLEKGNEFKDILQERTN